MSINNRRRMWPWPGVLLVVAAAGAGAFIYSYLLGADERTLALIQTVVAIFALGAPTVVWLRRRHALADTRDGSVISAAVADELAATVRTQWEAAASERGLRYPTPVAVRWRWSDRPVTGPVADAVGGMRLAPLPGLPPVSEDRLRRGEIRDLFGVYGGLDSGRLIILGSPGAGKSAAAIMLLLGALAHRRRMDPDQRAEVPVPLLLTLTGWNPARQHAVDWLTQQLAADYPFLAAGAQRQQALRRLIESGLVAPFLDGLDEVPEPMRPLIIQALNVQLTGRLVLLSRSRELVDAVAGGHLVGAAVVELESLTPVDAADYLSRCQRHPLAPAWQRLVDHLRTQPDSLIAQVLDNPLMLTLVRDTFPDAEQIDTVLDPTRYRNRQELEDMLLDRVLQAAYRSQPGRPAPPCTPAQARRWLGFLAHSMNQDHTRDLAWWRIPGWTGVAFRIATSSVLHGLILGLAMGWLVDVAVGLVFGALQAVIIALVGIGFALSSLRGGRQPIRLANIRWENLVSARSVAAGPILGIPMGLAFGLITSPANGLTLGCVAALVVPIMFGLWRAPRPALSDDSPVGPRTVWRQDRISWLVVGLLVGLTYAVAMWLAAGPNFGLAFGLAGALSPGLFGGAIWPAAMTFLQLRLVRLGPLRMLRFLEDARARHVLRTVGPVYQFRHARLQDRLAEEFHHNRHATGRPAPGAVGSVRSALSSVITGQDPTRPVSPTENRPALAGMPWSPSFPVLDGRGPEQPVSP